MTRSRIERVQPDAESAYGLCYQAVLKALVATLTAAGKRASSGAGSHVVLLREADRTLRLETAVATRVDHMRRSRHGVFYEGDEISAAELRAALADATTVINRVEGTL